MDSTSDVAEIQLGRHVYLDDDIDVKASDKSD